MVTRELDLKRLGARLKAAREKKGMRPEEAASGLAISLSTLANYERGRTAPKVDILLSWCSLVGIDYNDVLQGRFLQKLNATSSDLPDNVIPLDSARRRRLFQVIVSRPAS